METTEVVLLPCPFCCGKAAWGEGEQLTEYGNEQAYCTSCYAMTAPESSKTEAAEWWNMRVPHIHIEIDPDHWNPVEGGNKPSDDYW